MPLLDRKSGQPQVRVSNSTMNGPETILEGKTSVSFGSSEPAMCILNTHQSLVVTASDLSTEASMLEMKLVLLPWQILSTSLSMSARASCSDNSVATSGRHAAIKTAANIPMKTNFINELSQRVE